MSTMNAARKPSSSWIPCWIGGNSASPLNSTVHAGRLDRLADRILARRRPRERSSVSIVSENCASAYAMRPSSENVFVGERVADALDARLAVRGLELAVLSLAMAASTAAFRSGVSRRSPSGAAKTRFSTAPCSEENSDSMRSVAFWVSEPGISNSSLRLPPMVAHENDQKCDRRERAENDPPRVRRTRSAPSARALRSRGARARGAVQSGCRCVQPSSPPLRPRSISKVIADVRESNAGFAG